MMTFAPLLLAFLPLVAAGVSFALPERLSAWRNAANLGVAFTGSGQNMGVIFVVAARAKVSSLRVGLPWTYGLQSKLPSTTGRSALISLTAFHDPTG